MIQTVSVATLRAISSFVPCAIFSAIEQRDVDVEIEPRLVGRDVPAGHRRDDDAGHHVQRGVQAHQRIAPIPVDLEADRFADFRQRRAGGDDVRD